MELKKIIEECKAKEEALSEELTKYVMVLIRDLETII